MLNFNHFSLQDRQHQSSLDASSSLSIPNSRHTRWYQSPQPSQAIRTTSVSVPGGKGELHYAQISSSTTAFFLFFLMDLVVVLAALHRRFCAAFCAPAFLFCDIVFRWSNHIRVSSSDRRTSLALSKTASSDGVP